LRIIPYKNESTPLDLEWALSKVGAVKTEMEEDPRKPKITGLREGYVARRKHSDDEDDDEDN